MVSFLISRGGNVRMKDSEGRTPIFQTVCRNAAYSNCFAGKCDWPGIVQILASSGAEADIKDTRGATALMLALMDKNGYVMQEVAGQLKRCGASEDYAKAMTALTDKFEEAIEKGDLSTVSGILKDKPFLLYARDPCDRSILALAALYKRKEIVQFLISQGADVNDRMEGGEDEISGIPVMAVMQSLDDQCEGKQVEDPSALEIMALLISKGADVDRGNPLRSAAGDGYMKMGKLLIEKGADINLDAPIVMAAANSHYDFVKLLISHGADVNKKEIMGKRPSTWRSDILIKSGCIRR